MIEKLKNKKNGILGVLGFLLILVLMLLFLGLSKTTKEEETEEGTVLVEFEGAEEGVEGGSQKSEVQEEETPDHQPEEVTPPTPEEVMTQDFEEDAPEMIEVKESKNPDPKADPIEVKQIEEKKPAIFVPKYTAGKNKSSSDGGVGSGKGNNTGYGQGTGNSGSGIGKGGSGNNPEILGGSGVSIVSSPDLKPNSSEKGRVLVRITVNKLGKVISVEGGVTFRKSNGEVINSTTTNSELIRTAETDAKGSVYNVGPNARLEQTFYAIYNYNLGNK